MDTENERIANDDDDDLELKAVHMFYFLVTNKIKKPIKYLIKHIQGKHDAVETSRPTKVLLDFEAKTTIFINQVSI